MKAKDCIQTIIEGLEVGQWETTYSFLMSRPLWAGSMMPNYYNYPYNPNTHALDICREEEEPDTPDIFTVLAKSNNPDYGSVVPAAQKKNRGGGSNCNG